MRQGDSTARASQSDNVAERVALATIVGACLGMFLLGYLYPFPSLLAACGAAALLVELRAKTIRDG